MQIDTTVNNKARAERMKIEQQELEIMELLGKRNDRMINNFNATQDTLKTIED